ncbi:hypothetical protein B0O99DRAFT_663594 [Bisporella sp. PMI_857]|nr:hypothetical protein B0O99DRAFT_663594 [Bisporella sp. PMI_857]
MSLPVAIQSVLYYILSCSTCNKVIHRHKAKAQAQKDRIEKHRIETEQPGLYRHPSPFRTNPYWESEIAMGPNPVRKSKPKPESNSESLRALNTAGQGSSIASSRALSTEPPSSPSAIEGSRISGEGWNRKLYQRENELLWGIDTPGPRQRLKDAINKASSTAGRLFEGRLSVFADDIEGSSDSEDGNEDNIGAYSVGKNPPINDLHPPVVTTIPTNKAEMSWMLQPPPSAKVMEGKERVSSVRSRADSNISNRTGGSSTPLNRKATEKLVGAKLQQGGTPYPELRQSSSRLSSRHITPTSNGKGQRHPRNRSASSSDSSDNIVERRNKMPLSVSVPSSPVASENTAEYIPLPSQAVLKSSEMRELPSRPKLSTILSSSVQVLQASESTEDATLNSQNPSDSGRLACIGAWRLNGSFPGQGILELFFGLRTWMARCIGLVFLMHISISVF